MNKRKFLLITLCVLPIALSLLIIGILYKFSVNNLQISLSDILSLLTQYCSYVLTIVLAIIVYNQNERMNELERVSYDFFIGINRINNAFSFNPFFSKEIISKNDDYTILQNFSNDEIINFTSLDLSSSENKRNHLIALNLITKNKLLISEIDIQNIELDIHTIGNQNMKKKFNSSTGKIIACFDNNSNISLIIGFMVDDKLDDLDYIFLNMTVSLKDQYEKDHLFYIKSKLFYSKNYFYLSSCSTQKLKN